MEDGHKTVLWSIIDKHIFDEMKYFYFWMFIISILAFGLRIYRTDKVPPHLTNDEISIAYDAYSMLHTGRDEHGVRLPISFLSHGNTKAPLYAYMSVLPIYLYGNKSISLRILSVIMGTLTVLISGLIVYQLSKNKVLSIFTSLIVTTTPWLINSSRTAFETNLALGMTVLFVFSFLRWIAREGNIRAIFVAIFAALSMYAYHTQWGFIPLLGVSLLLTYRHKVKRGQAILGIIIFIILITPLATDYLTNPFTRRRANNDVLWKSVDIRHLPSTAMANYLSHFDMGRLFFSGADFFKGNDPFEQGLFLSPLIVLFAVGLMSIRKKGTPTEFKTVIIMWLFLAPVISSLTKGSPGSPRYLVMAIPIAIICALGWVMTSKKFKLVLGMTIFYAFFFFCVVYFKQFPYFSSVNYQYGYEQIANYIKTIYYDPSIEGFIIDPRFGPDSTYAGVPHLYISYYITLPADRLLARQDTPHGLIFDKFRYVDIDWKKENINPGFVYVLPESNLPPEAKLRLLKEEKIIYLPTSQPAFRIYRAVNI